MGIIKDLVTEIRVQGTVGYTKIGGKSKNLPDERVYSARKPAGCSVFVEFCLDCTEPDCTYKVITDPKRYVKKDDR